MNTYIIHTSGEPRGLPYKVTAKDLIGEKIGDKFKDECIIMKSDKLDPKQGLPNTNQHQHCAGFAHLSEHHVSWQLDAVDLPHTHTHTHMYIYIYIYIYKYMYK